MKNYLILFLICFLFGGLNVLHGQICEPSDTIIPPSEDYGIFGILPEADTINSPVSSLPEACVGNYYSITFQIYLSDSVSTMFNGEEIFAYIDSIRIDTIVLPDGLSMTCNPPDCMIENGEPICITAEGTPTQSGVFSVIIHYAMGVVVNGMPLNLPFSYPPYYDEYISPFPQREYIMTIHPANSGEAACIINDVDDSSEAVIGVQQNVPNPFSRMTSIAIDSKESGEFDFKVYSLIGELVHNEILTLSVGQNIVEFDGADLNSGMYFYAIGQGNDVVTKRTCIIEN